MEVQVTLQEIWQKKTWTVSTGQRHRFVLLPFRFQVRLLSMVGAPLVAARWRALDSKTQNEIVSGVADQDGIASVEVRAGKWLSNLITHPFVKMQWGHPGDGALFFEQDFYVATDFLSDTQKLDTYMAHLGFGHRCNVHSVSSFQEAVSWIESGSTDDVTVALAQLHNNGTFPEFDSDPNDVPEDHGNFAEEHDEWICGDETALA